MLNSAKHIKKKDIESNIKYLQKIYYFYFF